MHQLNNHTDENQDAQMKCDNKQSKGDNNGN
jgi:hypothetical protein